MRFVFPVITLTLLPLLASAGIYRWVDENGLVHFGDRPGDNDAATVEIRQQDVSKMPAAAVNHQQLRQRTLQMLEEDRHAREKAAEDVRRAQRERKAGCDKAQRRLATARGQGRFYVKKADGSRRYLTPAERDVETEKAGKAVRRLCGKTAPGTSGL